MKHTPPTRKGYALSSLALLVFFIAGVMVWKGFGKSQSDQTDDSASRLRNTGASAGNTGTLGATQAPPRSNTKFRIREKQLPYWVRHPEEIQNLTPEMAKLLVLNFKGDFLNLTGLTTLDAETAKALEKFKGKISR
jgi:hypothetical protein